MPRDPVDVQAITRLNHENAMWEARYTLLEQDLAVAVADKRVEHNEEVKASLIHQATFGTFDGMTSVIGIVFALLAKGNGAIILAAIGLAVASACGMAAGEYLSDDEGGIVKAMVMGLATAVGTLVPVLPFFFAPKGVALLIGGVLTLVMATGIGRVRQKGWVGYVQTYGILFGAAIATVLVSLAIPASAGG